MNFKKKLNEHGSVSFFIVFVTLSIVLLVLFALVIPLLTAINIEFFAAAEKILLDANATAAGFENEQIKAQLQESLGAQADSITTQVDILGTFFQYGWIIIIFAVLLVIFLATRETVEAEVR